MKVIPQSAAELGTYDGLALAETHALIRRGRLDGGRLSHQAGQAAFHRHVYGPWSHGSGWSSEAYQNAFVVSYLEYMQMHAELYRPARACTGAPDVCAEYRPAGREPRRRGYCGSPSAHASVMWIGCKS